MIKKYEYDYNRREIEERLKRLNSIARGTDQTILPFITDAKGKFSHKKAMAFINELIRTEKYLDEKEAKFIKAFLYCTLRCHGTISMYSTEVLEKFRACETFRDILERAETVDKDCKRSWIKNPDELMLYEYDMLDECSTEDTKSSFFLTMDRFYMWLTGGEYKSIDEAAFETFFKESPVYAKYKEDFDNWLEESAADLDAQDEELARENGYETYAEYESALEKEAKEAGFDSIGDYQYDLYFNNLSEEEQKELEDQQKFDEEFAEIIKKYDKRNRPAWDEFKKSFGDPGKFLDHYRQYRKLYFEVNRHKLYENVENMIYSFMYEHSLSLSVDDEAVLDELAVLDDITAQLSGAMRRSRKRYGL